MSFFRVQERRVSTGAWLTVAGPINNGLPILGPIVPIPAALFYGKQSSGLGLAGTAPANTGCTLGAVPVIDETVQTPLPMHIVLPRPAARFEVTNYGDSVGGTGGLLVSLDGTPMVRVPAGETLDAGGFGHMGGLISEVFLAAEDADACDFRLIAGIDQGILG